MDMAIPLAEPLPQEEVAPDTLNGRDARGRRIRGRKPAGRARKSRCQSRQSLRCCTRAGELRSAKGERKKRATEPLFRIPSLLFEDAESWASHPAGNKLHKISSPASSRRPEVSVCLALPPRCLSQVSGSVRTGRGRVAQVAQVPTATGTGTYHVPHHTNCTTRSHWQHGKHCHAAPGTRVTALGRAENRWTLCPTPPPPAGSRRRPHTRRRV